MVFRRFVKILDTETEEYLLMCHWTSNKEYGKKDGWWGYDSRLRKKS
jgi:hypothetical protein